MRKLKKKIYINEVNVKLVSQCVTSTSKCNK